MGWRAQRFERTPLTIVIEGVEPFAEARPRGSRAPREARLATIVGASGLEAVEVAQPMERGGAVALMGE
jgi:hypothetical protein